jgi:hypothetical protein
MDIPTFGKKHSLPQNNDIPKRTWRVGGKGDSLHFF